jgi:hypothetical protein
MISSAVFVQTNGPMPNSQVAVGSTRYAVDSAADVWVIWNPYRAGKVGVVYVSELDSRWKNRTLELKT